MLCCTSRDTLRSPTSGYFWYSVFKLQTCRFCSSSPVTRSRSLSMKVKNIRTPKAAFKVQPSDHSIILNGNPAQEKNNKWSFQSRFLKYSLSVFICFTSFSYLMLLRGENVMIFANSVAFIRSFMSPLLSLLRLLGTCLTGLRPAKATVHNYNHRPCHGEEEPLPS